ncbi:ABC transporter substrate-binding protein [Deinococcus misasensis]|uniref:ABC transporter substrate-binding protein n=1 Tax=Deinococcus misasensis TaxID=392413 RepID=UPI000A7740EF|nr:extracellular solute-binding protein [Deinococcus misasensis]
MKKTARLVLSLSLLIPVASAQSITLRVTGFKQGAEIANIPQINELFMKENPNIKVVYEPQPGGAAYYQVMTSRLNSGDAQDVIMSADFANSLNWGINGLILDLSKESWAKRISPQIKAYVGYKNKVYRMPHEVMSLGLYVNLDLLNKAGITALPSDFPGFLGTLDKLKKAGINPFYIPNRDGWGAATIHRMMFANSVYRSYAKWDDLYLQKRIDFNKGGWTTAVDNVKKLEPYVNFRLMNGLDPWSQANDEFMAGKVAFLTMGAWQAQVFKKQNPNLKFAYIPFPGGKKGTQPVGLVYVGTSWVVNAKSKNIDAAKKYLEFWSRNEPLKLYLDAENAFTPFKDGVNPSFEETRPFVAAVNAGRVHAVPFAVFPTKTSSEKVVTQSVQEVFSDPSVNSQSVVDKIQKNLNEALKNLY